MILIFLLNFTIGIYKLNKITLGKTSNVLEVGYRKAQKQIVPIHQIQTSDCPQCYLVISTYCASWIFDKKCVQYLILRQ